MNYTFAHAPDVLLALRLKKTLKFLVDVFIFNTENIRKFHHNSEKQIRRHSLRMKSTFLHAPDALFGSPEIPSGPSDTQAQCLYKYAGLHKTNGGRTHSISTPTQQ
uniref:Uncharacterized protein n=1 Tax=Cacopsylla melanoneura TaxID=428564 RepID=A0A8D8RAL7_9HEMI